MRVLIVGIDGYLGWTLAMYLGKMGYEVYGTDNGSRRKNVEEVGSWSATPITSLVKRTSMFHDIFKIPIITSTVDVTNTDETYGFFNFVEPHVVVHLGEQPSAPYSMMGPKHANYTQTNNIVGTNNILFAMRDVTPEAHLVKLGTMGEYGTPNLDIPEGFFEIEYRGRKDTMVFPKNAGSFYHLSKVHDSENIRFACKTWDLRSTDIMQGPVYGVVADETTPFELLTRFDFDGVFGTVINRFTAQAIIGEPLTPYGSGGQTRGYLSLVDSMKCMKLAIDNPPFSGEYRVFNQFDRTYGINDLARRVCKVAKEFGLNPTIDNIENPRIEKEEHYYNPDHSKLENLGYIPTRSLEDELRITIPILMKYKDRIEAKKEAMKPKVKWSK